MVQEVVKTIMPHLVYLEQVEKHNSMAFIALSNGHVKGGNWQISLFLISRVFFSPFRPGLTVGASDLNRPKP